MAGLGVLFFTYLFLKKIVNKLAILGVLFLVLSPWFLKLIAFPVTDMLYLLFVSAAFYFFLNKSHWAYSVSSVLLGVLTRFEGVLLVLSGFINFFQLRKRFFILLAWAAIPGLGILLFFRKFVPRFFAFFKDIVLAQKTYLYIFQNPLDFLNVIYGNVLFFIPYSYPDWLKWGFFIIILILFGYGAFRLYKIDKRLSLVLLVYEFFFFIAKGHINTSRPDIEFRRVFSGLWIFYLLTFIGGYFLAKEINKFNIPKKMVFSGCCLFMITICFSIGSWDTKFLLLMSLVILPLEFSLREFHSKRMARYFLLLLIFVFSLQIFQTSYIKSREYVDSMANKGAFAAAQWLNLARLNEESVVLSYVNNQMLDYYQDMTQHGLQKVNIIHFTIPPRNTPENKILFMDTFFAELKKHKVDYILFDDYVVQQPEFLGINDVHRMLYEEKENPNYFRIKKYLVYKGKSVGYVLKPNYDQKNR